MKDKERPRVENANFVKMSDESEEENDFIHQDQIIEELDRGKFHRV